MKYQSSTIIEKQQPEISNLLKVGQGHGQRYNARGLKDQAAHTLHVKCQSSTIKSVLIISNRKLFKCRSKVMVKVMRSKLLHSIRKILSQGKHA